MSAYTDPTVPGPGYFIREELEARGWTQRDLAFVLGVGEQQVNKLLVGKHGISADMAKKLGAAFDVAPEFFVNLQAAYDLSRAPTPDPSVAHKGRLQSVYPVREMIKRGWLLGDVDMGLLEAQLARFFEVPTANDIPLVGLAAKKSRYDEEITAPQRAWAYRVRQIAHEMAVAKYTERALRSSVVEMKRLLSAPEEARHIPGILADCGVRLVVVEGLPGEKIDGVCTWLNGSAPVVGLSLRRDRIDNLWFVLRHELEHVLRKEGQDSPRVDVAMASEDDAVERAIPEEELAADRAALDFCVPLKDLDAFIARKAPYISERDVLGFAARLQVHPGLVAGQVRARLKRWNIFTKHLVKVRQELAKTAVVDGWGTVVPVSS